jgi:alpha-D-ribose 1-methylphosphonate 5-triphosphate synthase subunit PhnH
MTPDELLRIAPGFGDAALDSQRVFRAVLRALAQPGQLQDLSGAVTPPPGCGAAAAAVLLALLDPDCALWLAPTLRATSAAAWLRFHTGCRVVAAPGQADFVWAAHPDELPRLDALAQGSEFDPETAATCVLEVPQLRAGAGWTLRGPGIRDAQRLAADALGADFVSQWQANHARFPRGVDLLLARGTSLAGLARTTCIEG